MKPKIANFDRVGITWEPLPGAAKYETGTFPNSLALCSHTSLQYIETLGLANIRAHARQLTDRLQKELPVIDRDIDTMVRGSPLWREKEDLLVTFPGVGNTIARSVLADVPELGRLDRRKIASLIGVAPFTRRSGKWKGKSMIGGGRPAARSAIFLAALSAIRCNPVLRAFYQRLLAQGKPKMVALIAVARKIVTILNAMLRDKKQWQPA